MPIAFPGFSDAPFSVMMDVQAEGLPAQE